MERFGCVFVNEEQAEKIKKHFSSFLPKVNLSVKFVSIDHLEAIQHDLFKDILSSQEILDYEVSKKPGHFLLKHLAAKFALLEINASLRKMPFSKISIARDDLGCPYFDRPRALQKKFSLSISDEKNYIAVVVASSLE